MKRALTSDVLPEGTLSGDIVETGIAPLTIGLVASASPQLQAKSGKLLAMDITAYIISREIQAAAFPSPTLQDRLEAAHSKYEHQQSA